jgi:septal ring factor EnvC (AmiA/AmiB activator)
VLELMRRKRYLGIVLDHDQKLIEGLSERTAELARLDRDLKDQTAALQEERSRVVTVRAAIRREREQKKVTLYRIRHETKLRQQALDEMERAAAALQELINRSTAVEQKQVGTAKFSGKPAEATPGAQTWSGFEDGKGRLDLPVHGTIIGGFGRRLDPDLNVEVFRKGMDIAAPEGEEIRAVASGRVIFSNRLAGYGRMVILDHGNRYYTVYAHLSKLDKNVGERVMRGESIGEVGDSGTFGEPRLYFEVRKDGRPIDPAPWFKPTSLRAATARLGPGETRKASR